MAQNRIEKQAKILVIEDEADIRNLLSLHLQRESYLVTQACDGEEGWARFQKEVFDLLMVDWMLPQLSGIDLIRMVRQSPAGLDLPILMVTARDDAADIVRGLEAGADDYVTKPFDVPVLQARVRALLRRGQSVKSQAALVAAQAGGSVGEVEEKEISVGDLRLDLLAHQVYCHGQEIHLTPSEFKLLHALAKNQGRVLTRERLIDLVQGTGVAVVDRAVDTHIFGLRKKLGLCGEWIETVRGVGYRFKADGQKL